jgi:hypothetical protein
MSRETNVRGQVGLRYGRGDVDRIKKIYDVFGASDFSFRDARGRALPDFTSGEIVKWNGGGIVIESKPQDSTKAPVKLWRLSGSVIKIFNGEE